jgi:hypothetical protein
LAKSDALKIAQIEERRELVKSLLGTGETIIKYVIAHPVTLGVLGFYMSDRLQGKYFYSEPVLREYQGKPAWVTTKQWNPTGGILGRGAAVALQTGLMSYLAAEALKTGIDLFKP